MISASDNVLLSLVRFAAGNDDNYLLPSDFDGWKKLASMSVEHGVAAIAVDGLSKYYENGGTTLTIDSPEMEDVKFEWFGNLCQIEEEYAGYENVISQLAEYYDGIGIKMMILKGYGVGLNWPVPGHRPVGDIDIWLFGRQKEADRQLAKDFGIEVDNSHHHHSVFNFKGLLVENHYNFINIYDKPSSRRIEKRLKQLSADAVPTCLKNIYLPSPDFHALFLLKHTAGHFSSIGTSLRQVLDWLFFVRAHHEQINWKALYDVLKEENLDRFANVLNAIGVKYLGFDPSYFPEIESDGKLVDRVLNDMFNPEFTEKEDGTLLSGLKVKPRRWWHNRWKHKICCSDPLLLSFAYGFLSKVLKPKHFID